MKYKIAAFLLTLTLAESNGTEPSAEEIAFRASLMERVKTEHATMSLAMDSSAEDSTNISDFNMLGAVILLTVALGTLIFLQFFMDKDRR